MNGQVFDFTIRRDSEETDVVHSRLIDHQIADGMTVAVENALKSASALSDRSPLFSFEINIRRQFNRLTFAAVAVVDGVTKCFQFFQSGNSDSTHFCPFTWLYIFFVVSIKNKKNPPPVFYSNSGHGLFLFLY